MKYLIVGLGKSGQSAAKLLQADGHTLYGFDDHGKSVTGVRSVSFYEAASFKYDRVIVSPGISLDHSLLKMMQMRGEEIVGEAQLGLERSTQRCIGITGTNGKTTVTKLITHVLSEVGIAARALGNVGEPLAQYFAKPISKETLVIELSSYQLETMHGAFFDAAAILNITPDHLDRHKTMHAYGAAKKRIAECLKVEAPLFVHESIVLPGAIACAVDRDIPSHLAPHDRENVTLARKICMHFGVSKEKFMEALESFEKPKHRLEFIASHEGVDYYNDSKGTNLDAVIRAVDAMQGDVILLAGGVDKGFSFFPWAEKLQGKVKRAILFGEAAPKIDEALSGVCTVERVVTLEEAVQLASKEARAGEKVLLSPGCSSFDQFRDYEERGDCFITYVNEITKELI